MIGLSRTRWSRAALCALLMTGLVACSEGEITTSGGYESDPAREVIPNGGEPTLSNEYFLVAAGDTDLQVGVGQDVGLQVFLYSKTSGDPVSGQQIDYEIVEGAELGSISARKGTTSLQGEASVDLRAGEVPGVVKIQVSHPSAEPIDFTIALEARPSGGLDVKLTNTAPSIVTLQNIDVRLYYGVGYSCTEFLPLRLQPDGIAMTQSLSVSQDVAFDALDPTQKYIVTGIARGSRGQIAAAGCVEDVRIAPDERTAVELPLQLIPLNPVGRYSAQSYWDFTQAVEDSGPIGSTLIRILNIFQNPGEALYDEIINLVNYAVGGIISGSIDTFLELTGLDDQFKDMINNFVEGNEVLRRVRDAGRDVRDVIANLHVTSELTVGKVSSSYEFTGFDNWLGVTVYWRWDCAPDAPPECGAIPLLVDGANDIAQLGILSSQWNGRVAAYDELQIDQHPLTLRYGRLIIYILNEVVIPALTDGNAHSMSEAFAYWIGCDSLATSITGSDGEICALGQCIYANDIEGFCSSAVGTVFGFADALVQNLEFDIGLRVGGEGTLVEETSDGFVDRIIDGTFEGHMTTNGEGQGAQAAPISATWEAVKLDFETNNL